MDNKINLDDIISEYDTLSGGYYDTEFSKTSVRSMMKEAICQALVLASKKAKNTISTNPNSDLGIKKAIEQSILDVNDLVM